MSLHHISSNNSKITNHIHTSVAGTDHCNSNLSIYIFSLRKTTTQFSWYFRKPARKSMKKNICLIYISRALKVIYRKSTQLIILYCLILTLITVCYMFRIKFPYLSLHIFSPSFSYFSHHEIFLKLAFNLITVFHTESFH